MPKKRMPLSATWIFTKGLPHYITYPIWIAYHHVLLSYFLYLLILPPWNRWISKLKHRHSIHPPHS